MKALLLSLLLVPALCLALDVEVLETAPVGTELDLPDIRNALDVLPGLFAAAVSSIDIAQMYMLYYRPESRGMILFAFYDALVAAAGRGVKVRILLDSTTLEDNATDANSRFQNTFVKSSQTYGKMRDSLNRTPGVEVRACDLRPYSDYSECMLHTKYILIDGRVAVIGSHNWSYSAFMDNREISLLVQDSLIGRELAGVFETDWAVAKSQVPNPNIQTNPKSQIPISKPEDGNPNIQIPMSNQTPNPKSQYPIKSQVPMPKRTVGRDSVELVITSPRRLRDSSWTATTDALRRVFARAREELCIEVNSLTTRVDFGDAKRFRLLDSLIRDAAERRVRVRLLVDQWAYGVEPELFQSLNSVDRIQVRVMDISDLGPNPTTGSVHAKLAIADGVLASVGSATFSQRQLLECRNAGLLVSRRAVLATLTSIFERDWNSGYWQSP